MGHDRYRGLIAWTLLGLLAPTARAQTAHEPASPPYAPPSGETGGPAHRSPHVASPGPRSPDQDDAAIAELDTIRVVGRRPQDPFAFRNPVGAEDTMFRRDWREPPSLYDIGMQGGLVQMAVGYALMQGAEAVKRLPGWKPQVEAANARPSPLDADQLARSARLASHVPASIPSVVHAADTDGTSADREAVVAD